LQACVTAAGIVENFVAHEYPTPKIKKLIDINIMGELACHLVSTRLLYNTDMLVQGRGTAL
jgi:hypothetical protein